MYSILQQDWLSNPCGGLLRSGKSIYAEICSDQLDDLTVSKVSSLATVAKRLCTHPSCQSVCVLLAVDPS